ncbi:Phosphate ABC transporter, periplasmic phosphate-binding protein PstS (TC 3.A.1.7.1) [invertebrate metagenome]|uniref:Phosphate ABC transporter, periplasmic phosphate-binding protein PstS (TC 3.A.1.7.1) n=1 Tax=invertebrate metagenome TaxID=1711999 RepID=A0A484H4J9_9ZZZZ
MYNTSTCIATVVVLIISFAHAGAARDQIRIVGSSTVYPFSTTVAERFGKRTHFKVPIVESTGSGGGMKLFCSGVGVEYPDITNASRRIKRREMNTCIRNGITDVVEIKIGYDGIVFAHAKTAPPMQMTRTQIFLALAKQIPKDNKLVDNPYRCWQDIDPGLLATRIKILGPPPTSGTRDALVELVMDVGCKGFPEFLTLSAKNIQRFHAACQMFRTDGAFIEAGENDNLIVQKLIANPKAFGILGFSSLAQNTDKLQAMVIDSQAPTSYNISDGHYPVARPLYFYVKKAHVGIIPGLKEYVAEFTSEQAWSQDGYLVNKGLIPLPDTERNAMREGTLSNLSFSGWPGPDGLALLPNRLRE